MTAIEATIPIEEASRYLQQLCKHWSHRFAVTFTPEQGRVPFDETTACILSATPGTLSLRIEAADGETAERMAGVLIQHLQRFAFRAPLEAPTWRSAG